MTSRGNARRNRAPLPDKDQGSSGDSGASQKQPSDERGRALLVSFAMLQVRWDNQNSSYIDNFVPFVAHCVKTSGAQAIATQEVQNQLQSRFGLVLPQYALNTVIKRGVRQGLFRLENHMLVPDEKALEGTNLEPAQQRAQRVYAQLLKKFVDFARVKHGRQFTEDQVDDAFLAYVTDRAIPIVRATLLGEGYQPYLANLGDLELLVADFIVHLSRTDVEGFDLLDMIVRGCMLATALYLPDPNDRARAVTDLTVYVDTPVLIDILGLTDDARHEAARELVKLLQDLGARVRCFSHTLQETENLLLASAPALATTVADGRTVNEIVSYAASRGWGRTQLELKAAQVERDLQALGISVGDAPDYRVRLSLDEGRLEEVLQTVVGYARPETRSYDVRSLTAIWRLREGRSQRHLESARAIFVTSNEYLVRASARFFEETPNGSQVPVATLDSQLGTVAWLKRPMAAPDLPKRQLVADCIAALEPGNQLWERFLEVIEQARADGGVSEEDYATLRYTVSARRALMEETLGHEDALAVGSVADILRRARETMTREAQEQVQTEALRRREAEVRADEESRRAELAETVLSAERGAHEKSLQSSEQAHKDELARRIGNKAHRRALRVAKVIYVILAVIIIGGAAAGAGLIGGGVATFFVLVAAALNTRQSLVNSSLSEFVSRGRRYLEKRFEERERRSLGL